MISLEQPRGRPGTRVSLRATLTQRRTTLVIHCHVGRLVVAVAVPRRFDQTHMIPVLSPMICDILQTFKTNQQAASCIGCRHLIAICSA